MKKLVMVAVLATAFASNVQAQEKVPFLEKVTLEASYGYNQAFSPDNVDRTDVSGLKTIQLGANYQINDFWGVRGTYSNTQFEHKDFDGQGVTFNKITAEATFTVLKAILKTTNENASKFDVIAHAGFGLNFGKSKVTDATDTMGNFQIGLKPEYKVSNRVGIFVDGTYIMNFSQNVGYNGAQIPGDDTTTGGYATGLIGVSIKLGK